jgi:hypothetical protein
MTDMESLWRLHVRRRDRIEWEKLPLSLVGVEGMRRILRAIKSEPTA